MFIQHHGLFVDLTGIPQQQQQQQQPENSISESYRQDC